jgi:hypothetical protein
MNELGVIRLSNDPELVLPMMTNLLQDIQDGCSRQDAEAIRAGLNAVTLVKYYAAS